MLYRSWFDILEHKDTKKRRFYIVSSFSEKTLCIFVSLCLKLYQLNNYAKKGKRQKANWCFPCVLEVIICK